MHKGTHNWQPGKPVFRFLRSLYIDYYSGFDGSHLHQWCTSSFGLYPGHYLLMLVFLMDALLTRVRGNVDAAFILMSHDW